MRCAEARSLVQQRRDAGLAPDGELARHLAGCASCARFRRFVAGLGAEAREALDAAAADLPRPAYAAICGRAGRGPVRRPFAAGLLRPVLAAAAAVLVTAGGISAGVSAWLGGRERHRVAEQVRSFVEELFAEPPLADPGFPLEDRGPGLRDWLDDPRPSFLP